MKPGAESVRIVSISLPNRLVKKIDHYRKDVSRSKFVHRLLEKGFEYGNESRSDSHKPRNLEKQQESFDKVTKAKTNALGKGTEIHNIKKQIRTKSGIESTCNRPIPCLKREFLATVP